MRSVVSDTFEIEIKEKMVARKSNLDIKIMFGGKIHGKDR